MKIKKLLCVLMSGLMIGSGAMMNVHAQDQYKYIMQNYVYHIGKYYFKYGDFDCNLSYSTSKKGPYTTILKNIYADIYTNGENVMYEKGNATEFNMVQYNIASQTTKTILKKIVDYDFIGHYILFEKGKKKETTNQYDINKGTSMKLGNNIFLIKDDAIDAHHVVLAKNENKVNATAQAYLGTLTKNGVKLVNTKQRMSLEGKTLGKNAFYYSQPTYTSPKKNVLKETHCFYKIGYDGKHKKYLGSTTLTCKTKVYKTKSGKVTKAKTLDKNRIWIIRDHNFTYTNAKYKRMTKKFSK